MYRSPDCPQALTSKSVVINIKIGSNLFKIMILSVVWTPTIQLVFIPYNNR